MKSSDRPKFGNSRATRTSTVFRTARQRDEALHRRLHDRPYGRLALNIVPPMACRQAFGHRDYANIFSMVATDPNVFSGFAALIYAQIFDITGSFAGCLYPIIGFYVVTLICRSSSSP